MAKRIYLIIGIILIVIALSVYGCGSTTTIIQQVPTSVYTPPPTSTSAPITTVPPIATSTLWSVQDQIFKPSTYDTAPPNGIYVQAGKTLTFSWSADGGLVGYIFTANQYGNWENNILGLPSSYEGYNSGSTGSITVTIQNGDTYCAVLFNNALGILGSGPNVEVYQATLTEH